MSALDIFQRAQAAGITITATPAGSLELCGPSESIRTLAPEVRTHKQDLLRHFADPRYAASARMQAPAPEVDSPRRLWLLRHADGRLVSHSFCPPASLAEVRAWYPEALAIEAEEEDAPEAGPDRMPPDDRITCTACRCLARGRCLAARHLPGMASWHEPDSERLHACYGYLPLASDPDPRPGKIRWPSLAPNFTRG